MIDINEDIKELTNRLTEKVNRCYDNTCYSEYSIKNMLSNGLRLLNYLFLLNGTEYKIESENVEGKIKIKGFHFNHNDILIYFDDYFSKRALKEIFNDWKENKHITRYTTDGHVTAFVIGFDDIYVDSFDNFIKRIKTTNEVTKDDFDEKLKNVKYI